MLYKWTPSNDNAVVHYGIKGMRWGVRRYQNYDGTRTPAGKRRYKDDYNSLRNRYRRRFPKKTREQSDSEYDKRKASKNRGSLTLEELSNRITRLEMEKKLRELTAKEVNSGSKEVKNILGQVGKRVSTTALSGATLYGIMALLSKEFNPKDFGSAMFNGGPKKKK